MPLKILFTHRYFWPDTPPYAAMLREIAGHLAARGDEVTVFSSQPSYGSRSHAPRCEQIDGITVRRVWTFHEKGRGMAVRVVNLLIYCSALFVYIIRSRPDVVTAATFPPVAAGWVASLAARLCGAHFVYHVQDVHPEVSQVSGDSLGRGLPFRVMRALDDQTLRRSSRIVVLSGDMLRTLRARRNGKALPIEVINNLQLARFGGDMPQPPASLVKPAGRKRFIFAGNLGRFQRLEVLTEGILAALENYPEAELLYLGDGESKPRLQSRWGSHPQVRFGPFLPFAQAEPLLRDSDIGLVSLSPGIYRVSFPSKVLTYLGLGLPMLALVERESALAEMITENGLGAVPTDASLDAIAEAASALLENPVPRPGIHSYHRSHSSTESVLDRWSALIAELAAPHEPERGGENHRSP